MNTQPVREYEESVSGDMPEDVAVLYSWANLHGAKYRDFSASRREYRAQVRHRAAEELHQAELQAQAEAEKAAAEAEQTAREAERVARETEASLSGDRIRDQALRTAGEAARVAAAERVEASRRAEAAAVAEAAARREEREVAEAHASAARQAARYAESEPRRRALAVPQPAAALLPGPVTDPYVQPQGAAPEVDLYSPNNQLEVVQPGRFAQSRSPEWPAEPRPAASPETRRTTQDTLNPETAPAWLFERQSSPAPPRPVPVAASNPGDPLQHSRERVASRWYAPKGAPEGAAERPAGLRFQPQPPLLAIFSLAGGAGKTSLAATLGRALSSLGEKVMLADTSSHGLLPFYFGATELKPGVVRTFSPPAGSPDAAIQLVSYDLEPFPDQLAREALSRDLLRVSAPVRRTLVDLQGSSSWLIRQLVSRALTVLVPLVPDMNSVITLAGVERALAGLADHEGRSIQPYYVLNQFDPSLPLHGDVQGVLRRQLGERLLPHTIRRAPSVGESLAEGMTVVDYAPGSPVAEDYLNLANWVRSLPAPGSAPRANRWSER